MHNTGGAMDPDLTILSNKFKTNYQLYPDTCRGKVPELVKGMLDFVEDLRFDVVLH